jgi:hypothetical protein
LKKEEMFRRKKKSPVYPSRWIDPNLHPSIDSPHRVRPAAPDPFLHRGLFAQSSNVGRCEFPATDGTHQVHGMDLIAFRFVLL